MTFFVYIQEYKIGLNGNWSFGCIVKSADGNWSEFIIKDILDPSKLESAIKGDIASALSPAIESDYNAAIGSSITVSPNDLRFIP